VLKNYYGDFENIDKEIICLEIRCTNLGVESSLVHVYTATLDGNKLGTVFKTTISQDETFVDIGKTIIGQNEKLVCASNSSFVEFKIGVSEDVL
jgi:hypothetical protein